jgi:serine protease Do
MKNKYFIWMAIIVILFILSKPITADLLTEEDKTVSVAESLLKSTVIIIVNGGGGSGFYISSNEIVTNHHVINDSKSVFIKKSNGTQCLADIVFTQSDPDLALLKTDCEGKPIPLAESVKVGQSVITMGNPLGQSWYVSKGIVGLLKDGEFLHDAVIDQGMSGGPVVDLNGQLVGVTQAFAKDAPKISFAIDSKTLSYFLYQAKEVK